MPVKDRTRVYVHTENQLESLFLLRVRAIGGRIEKLVAASGSGRPDRLVMLPGQRGWPARMYLVELKTATGKLEPLQREWHRRAAELNIHVVTLYGLDEIDAWVRERAQEYDHLLDLL